MKKHLFLACTILSFATISQAQIKKGSVLLGGSLGYSKQHSENGTNENEFKAVNFTPTVGIAFKDNWIAGVSGGLSWSTSKSNSLTPRSEVDGYSAGVFVRRYAPLGKNFYLYGNAGFNYSKLNREEVLNTDQSRDIVSKGVSLAITPGLAYAISKRFHLEAYLNNLLSLNYQTTKTENLFLGGKTTTEDKSFDFGTNFSTSAPLSIGFRFILGK